MMGATCKAIRDMHRSHYGNEEAGWIRNQLKRDPGKLIPTKKLIIKALRALLQIIQNLRN